MRLLATLVLPALLAVSPAFADTLAAIKDRGTFVFGLEAQYKPFEFRDENNEIIGYDIDVAAEIGKRLGGLEPKPMDTNWPTVIQSLYNGEFDLIIGGMTATAERYQRVNFSYPYMDASSGLLVLKDAGIGSPADLAGKSVAAGAGTPQIQQFALAAEENGIAYEGEVRSYDNATVAVAAMRAGRVDAYASTLVNLLDVAKESEDLTVIPFTSTMWAQEFTAMAFRKEDETLRAEFNRIIAEMKADGTLGALQEKWFGQSFVDILPDEAPAW